MSNSQTSSQSPQRNTYWQIVTQLASAQKSAAPGAPAYSLLINRRLGRLLAAGAFKLGLTPNIVTIISALVTFSGIAVLAAGNPTWATGVVICLLLVLGYALDSADGQLARLRGGGSLSGEWLDHVVDSIKISCLHLAVLIIAYRHFDWLEASWLLVPIAFSAVAAVSFFAMILNDHLKEINTLKTGLQKQAAQGNSLRSLILIPTDYGFLCLAFVLIGAPKIFVALYSLLFLANLGHLILALGKWFRDMKKLDALRMAQLNQATSNDSSVVGS